MTSRTKILSIITIVLIGSILGGSGMGSKNSVVKAADPLPTDEKSLQRLRDNMVEDAVIAAGIKNERVIKSMRKTPREKFVPLHLRNYALTDSALPIGSSQTISPPFIVAFMTETLNPQPGDKVLEIGTGSGYQAAVLSPLVKDVYTIEIVESLGKTAEKTLEQLGYENVHTKIGDGYKGWPEHAPFDKIIVTCSPEKVPEPLVEQLAEGGRMIIPIGERYCQMFYLFTKKDGKLEKQALRGALFVPMTGEAESKRDVIRDPADPRLNNGDFSETLENDETIPIGWHYLRRVDRIKHENPDEGAFMQFENDEPGRPSQMLQGFPIDGSKVHRITLQLRASGENIREGIWQSNTIPNIVIDFYDENRDYIRYEAVRPFRGSFDWFEYSQIIDVPVNAREAVLHAGLRGATGRLKLDWIKITKGDER